MVNISITMDVIPVKRLEFEQTIHALNSKLKNSKGYMGSHIYRNLCEGNTYCLISEWRTTDEMKKHMKSKAFTILTGAIRNLCYPPKANIKSSAVLEEKIL